MSTIDPKQLQAIKRLYYNDGMSMQQIANHFLVKIDAVIYFMRKHHLTRRNRSQANQAAFAQKPLTFAIPKVLTEVQKEIKLIGVTMYWSEGAKRGHTVDLANSDPDMIRLFLLFLRKVCHVDEKRIRAYIYCHKNQSPRQLVAYWSKVMDIPLHRFSKPYVRRKRNQSPKKRPERMHYGLVHARYSDLKLLRQILTWIEELKYTWVGTQVDNEDGL